MRSGIMKIIEDIDLEPIVFLLVENSEGPQWTLERARMAEKWYRCFLFLVAKYPNEVIIPTKEIDKVWHTHMLDTQKYFADCRAIFGRYLHHFPYLGVRGDDDKKVLERAFRNTLKLFKVHFPDLTVETAELSRSAVCSGHVRSDSTEQLPPIADHHVDFWTRPVISG